MQFHKLPQEYQALPYRRGVGIMMLNRYNEVFVGRRLDTRSEAWQMPQGGVDDDETYEQAAMRELKEESGTDNAAIINQSKQFYYYDLPEYLVPKLWGGKYRGQQQRWFAIRFLGSDKEIDIHREGGEFSQWRWANSNELLDIVVPFKRKLYLSVLQEFHEILERET
jgi:putative (di)nucleoside polyphosphate hydrolase